jgi:hypothetical protein
MIKRFGAALAVMMMLGTAAAYAVTQEYTVSVPVSITGIAPTFGSPPHATSSLGVTIHCAVGTGSVAYSSATGDAQNAAGEGDVHLVLANPTTVNGPPGKGPTLTFTSPSPAVVTLTVDLTGIPTAGLGAGAAKGPNAYVCWGVLDKDHFPTTPVNYITGPIR